jgi:hypothetical protein
VKLDNLIQVINNLTSDEDLQQELWVYYLSGNSQDSLPTHLEDLIKRAKEPEELKQVVYHLMIAPANQHLSDLIASFSPLEQSVICLLVIGYDIASIAHYKGITEVRIRHLISVIKANSKWDDFQKVHYGIKETIF